MCFEPLAVLHRRNAIPHLCGDLNVIPFSEITDSVRPPELHIFAIDYFPRSLPVSILLHELLASKWDAYRQLGYFTSNIVPTDKLGFWIDEAYILLDSVEGLSTEAPVMTELNLRMVCVKYHTNRLPGIFYLRDLHGRPICRLSVSSTRLLSQLLYRKLLQDQSSTMQITSIAIVLFAAMCAVANPIATESDGLDARGVELSKYGGVSSSYEISVEMADISEPL